MGLFNFLFLSTPSARRATFPTSKPTRKQSYFYPRPPRGGRPTPSKTGRRGGDFYPRPPRGGRPSARFRSPTLCLNFYPRPPRGGRPELYTAGRLFNGISIHALREEGDAMRSTPSSTSSRFLSTPSARRATACENHRTRPECYFYPRPPRGGRPLKDDGLVAIKKFLSTPSARRATSMPCST